jgi:hypothetical protein
MSDAVDHPAHYNTHPAGIECIEIVEWLPFCHGNAVKYLWRADHKGARVEDLKKALWYVERAERRPVYFTNAGPPQALLARALEGFSGPVREIIHAIVHDQLYKARSLLGVVIEIAQTEGRAS